jgi:hypothetical protein
LAIRKTEHDHPDRTDKPPQLMRNQHEREKYPDPEGGSPDPAGIDYYVVAHPAELRDAIPIQLGKQHSGTNQYPDKKQCPAS